MRWIRAKRAEACFSEWLGDEVLVQEGGVVAWHVELEAGNSQRVYIVVLDLVLLLRLLLKMSPLLFEWWRRAIVLKRVVGGPASCLRPVGHRVGATALELEGRLRRLEAVVVAVCDGCRKEEEERGEGKRRRRTDKGGG